MNFRKLIAIFLFGLGCAQARAADIVSDVPILDLKVTQFNIGFHEVELRMAKLRSAIAKGTLDKYLSKRPLIGVIGPDGEIYLIDGHHLATALYRLGIKKVNVVIERRFSNEMSLQKFWKKMAKNDWVHASDQGVKRPPTDLPSNIRGLTDDVFRSVAWAAREDGAYKKLSDAPFQEFEWADYFRGYFKQRGWKADFSSPQSTAITLSQTFIASSDEKAKNLSGYTKRSRKEVLACVTTHMESLISEIP